MADPRGFLTTPQQHPERRPVAERVQDWKEVYKPGALLPIINKQAGRCMDCGIPFCHNGCPLGNIIPEWNDLVWKGDWEGASDRLHATNNFPEFTGRLCPAPCETACVLGINQPPVTIKNVEVSIIDRAWEDGTVRPLPPERLSGRTVAVYERADRIGGLLRYGIPEFKMEKRHLNRRIEQMRAEGTKFRPGMHIGVDLTGDALLARYDAIVLAVGSTKARELDVPGRDLAGVHQAMDYLPYANKTCEGDYLTAPIDAFGKHVVVIGGGDTGADCLGTATRQGAESVTQLEIMPQPGQERPANQPWPTYPMIFRVSSAHEENGERVYAVSTTEFVGDENGRVKALRLVEVEFDGGRPVPVEGTEREIPADLVLLAMGFVGPERGNGLIDQLGLALDERGNIARDGEYATNVPGVFVAGDAGRGQSLIVWAIAEGRAAAAAVDRYLTGSTNLPAPIRATERPLVV